MDRLHTRRWIKTAAPRVTLVCLALSISFACAAGRAFQKGNDAVVRGDWDMAAAMYASALQQNPNRLDYRMALERAQLAAAQLHFEKARDYEKRDQLDLALLEYRKVAEFHSSNQEARNKVAVLEQTIRDRAEAARPRPAIEALREKARKTPAEPLLDPRSREAIDFTQKNAQLRDILIGMGTAAGIAVNFDGTFVEKQYSVELKNISFEQALQQVTAANQLFYKVIGDRSIIIIPDNPQKRQAYEEQAVQTFYLSHSDPTEMLGVLNQVIRVQQAIPPVMQANKNNNTIVVRASVPMLQIIGRVIDANDKPRAEVIIDVEILEINRNRAKQYGLELSQYGVGLAFSPESAPGGSGTGTGTGGTTASTTAGQFNLNTLSKGVSTNDFYGTVPSAVIRFLESDVNTKVIAKPQLRGSEGEALSLNLGEDVPVPSTTFTPIVGGGTAYNPMTSFGFRSVGVNLKLKPRVTYEDDVIIELELEVSAQGADKNIAGQNLPSFTSRKVTTKLRLRDGESNLLAGLLREDERQSLKGLPGTLNVPILKQLFASNDNAVAQTDIVMLLTPHVIRTHELTAKDLAPIYIGSQQDIGISGPPPTFGQVAETPPAAAAPPATTAGGLAPGAVVPGPPGSPITAMMPPGTSPIPGTVGVPAKPAPPAAGAQTPPAGAAAPPVQTPPQPAAQAAPPAAVADTPKPPQAPAAVPLTATVTVGTPSAPMMVAGGPYTLPIAVTGASRLSTVTVSLTFNPRVLRVRLAQEGDFMRKGDAKVTFAFKTDEPAGRIDITITRTNDTAGATGDGMLAGVLFDAIGAGESALSLSGVATAPGGTPVPLKFVPAAVTVR